jgi:GLPGLI family protein
MNLKKINFAILILTLIWLSTSAQKINEQDTFDYFVQYKLSYKIDSMQKDPKVEYFALSFNQSIAGFRSSGNYLFDSIKYTPAFLNKSNMEKIEVAKKYASNFPDYIRTDLSKKTATVTIQTSGKSGIISPQYVEHVNIYWQIFKDKKIINGVACTKAETNVYGRKWTAWFSNEHPFPLGPYKFFGLPGLIFEISDQNETYHYSLYNIKKKEKIYPINVHENILKVSKTKSIELYNLSKYSLAGFADIDEKLNADLINKLKVAINNRKLKENNPIELKP